MRDPREMYRIKAERYLRLKNCGREIVHYLGDEVHILGHLAAKREMRTFEAWGGSAYVYTFTRWGRFCNRVLKILGL